MTDTILQIQQRVVPILRHYGVVRAAVFGSLARGEGSADSDLDLVVEFERGRSLIDLAGLRLDLEEILGREADVVTYRSLHPRPRGRILKDQVSIL